MFEFFVVEGPEISAEWVKFAAETVSEQALRSSLPHRTMEERAFIKGGVLGVTTWQKVCDGLGIDRKVLVEEVATNSA